MRASRLCYPPPMQPANDPARDYVRLVADGYDACASAFNAARAAEDGGVLAPLLARLPQGARVLDLGCGAGVPIASTLVGRGCHVTGVDISAGQLARAHGRVPAAGFVRADMRTCAFAPRSFDAVVSFYAIFHLPRVEHQALFERIASWLRPGGYLLASVGLHDDADYTEDFFGVEMFWSNYGIARYREMLSACGFTLLADEFLSHGYDDPSHSPETHPLLFAQVA